MLSNALKLVNLFQCYLDYLVGRDDNDIKTNFLDNPPFNTQLRLVLKKEKVTAYRISKDTRISNGYFHRWYNGSDIKISTLTILADYLNCTLDYLVGRE